MLNSVQCGVALGLGLLYNASALRCMTFCEYIFIPWCDCKVRKKFLLNEGNFDILGGILCSLTLCLLEAPKWIILVNSADEMHQNAGFHLSLNCWLRLKYFGSQYITNPSDLANRG